MGLSYTSKYPYGSYQSLKQAIKIPLQKYIFSSRNQEKTSFNYSWTKLKFFKDKAYISFDKLGKENIDIINILKLYNTGLRYLELKQKQIIIGEDESMYLNSTENPFYRKLQFIVRLINKN